MNLWGKQITPSLCNTIDIAEATDHFVNFVLLLVLTRRFVWTTVYRPGTDIHRETTVITLLSHALWLTIYLQLVSTRQLCCLNTSIMYASFTLVTHAQDYYRKVGKQLLNKVTPTLFGVQPLPASHVEMKALKYKPSPQYAHAVGTNFNTMHIVVHCIHTCACMHDDRPVPCTTWTNIYVWRHDVDYIHVTWSLYIAI